jgi:hypothetical protein
MNLNLYFSLITGDIYKVEDDEIKHLDKYQIPLKKRPSNSCKKCFGRFYWGKDLKTGIHVPCPKCMSSCIDWNKIKEGEIGIDKAVSIQDNPPGYINPIG